MRNYINRGFIFLISFFFLFFGVNIIGAEITKNGFLNITLTRSILWVLLTLILSLIISLFIKIVLNKFFQQKKYRLAYYNRYTFVYVFIINFLSYIPAFLAYFPSIWSYDIAPQVDQIFNIGYNRYQPIVHTFMIEICLKVGKTIFGNYTYGAMIYSLAQMIIMSICIAYAFNYACKNKKMSFRLQIVLLLFIVIMPYNAILAISTTKDVIFSGLTLVLIVKIYDLTHYKFDKFKIISFIIILLLWFSFRNNAYFAFLAFALITLIIYWKKKMMIILLTVVVIASNLVFNVVLDIALKAETISTAEMISVPGSQISRVAVYSPEKITEEQWNQIHLLFDDEYRNYNPYLFDDVKSNISFGVPQIPKLITLWINMLPNCLNEYIDAFLCLNIGSWYPLDHTYTRIYIDNYYDGVRIEGDLANKHTGYIQTLQSNVIDEIEFNSFLPSVHNYYERICSLNIYNDFAITQLLLSPATYLWIIIALLFYSIYKKDEGKALSLILLILYWCTILLGPCTVFRYMYPIVISSPFGLILCLANERIKESEK